jgi:hypothetical protein
MQEFVLNLRGLSEFFLDFAQTLLPFFDRATLGLNTELLSFDVEREFLEADFESVALFFELNFLGGEFFKPNDVALFLERRSSCRWRSSCSTCRKASCLACNDSRCCSSAASLTARRSVMDVSSSIAAWRRSSACVISAIAFAFCDSSSARRSSLN